ncbi:LOW QUALITY PROTEIN: hypothetical protein AJ80_03667 [Polytolypa hystricis UAMH7299]|uniref:Chromo domain-containing protein n=1 Tax=Polytolypa hystricis (strain UAMH7299) TaxID=1447883 RepID=A0A2B7YG94_POLH7|nr:LOW QUALITY PROTEIN: hypothetical protein AJ80_03667 [Polytolypa hystricis UAMH7299]
MTVTHQHASFSIGDNVLLKLGHGYSRPSTTVLKKYSNRYAGPYAVIETERISALMYKLDFLAGSQVHSVYRAPQKAPRRQASPYNVNEEKLGLVNDREEYEIERGIAKRTLRPGEQQYLVKWKEWSIP